MKASHYLMAIAAIGVPVASFVGITSAQSGSVVNTPHNLSSFGPGSVRAASEEQICIFCHATHNASPIQPLWNRMMPITAYSVYTSDSLDAVPGQPTGASKLCLSCHDGTIAIGSVVSRDQTIQMAGGITTIPSGSSNLGTDLSDDHPISFRYDSTLVGEDPRLVDPGSLPPEVPLDHNGELQCTSCHDAHDNSFGDFLVMPNVASSLCYACHQQPIGPNEAHNDCKSCHQPHSSPSGPYLLVEAGITETCLRCHNYLATSGGQNIRSDMERMSGHDTSRSSLDPSAESYEQVGCTDCHSPHTMTSGIARSSGVPASLGQINGVNASGVPIEHVSFEYEVCFKCHADDTAFTSSWVPRQITQTNTRYEFAPSAVSFHPVIAPGVNPDVPSLRPEWTVSSTMSCSDCHGSSTSAFAGGSGPNGVHGSDEPPLLVARYDTADYSPESLAAYALCYRCHYRDETGGVLEDRSFAYHDLHVRGENTTCSTCHDAHGVSSLQGTVTNNSHLINFDSSIVFPDPVTGRLEFVDAGRFSGTCYLRCHGVNHSPEVYSLSGHLP